MARRFAKVSEEEIEEAFFYQSDSVNTKTAIPLRVGEERWIYTSTFCVSVYIHHYSPPLRGIVVKYKLEENCELRGTDNVQGEISKHIFAAKLRLLCLFSIGFKNWGISSNIPQF